MSQYKWLLESFPVSSFTVFDTETTGLEPRINRVVEAGAIRFDVRGINSRFNVLINPGVPMPPEVTKINGITDAMLKGQPDASVAIPDFARFLGTTVLIAHNAPFDVNFINAELSRIGKPSLTNKVVDTRIFAREMFPGLPKYALQDLAQRFGITAKEAHRAEDDARVCMELFLVCYRELEKRFGSGLTGSPAQQIGDQASSAQAAPTTPTDLFSEEEDYEEEEDFGDITE